MKPTHLKTLSATVEELYKLVCSGEITSIEFRNLTVEANWDLKQPATLAHFVPCDKNGVPLENKGECSCAGNTQHCHGCNSMHYHCDVFKDSEAYNEAQKSVIFEGWEVLPPESMSLNLEIKIANGDWCWIFSKKTKALLYLLTKCKRTIYYTSPQYPKSLADLAAATQSNPLKLK